MKAEFDVCSMCKHLKEKHHSMFNGLFGCTEGWPYDSWFPDDKTCKCTAYVD